MLSLITCIFCYTKINGAISTKIWFSLISLLSITLYISNHWKAPLRCLAKLHTNFQLIPVSSLPCRWVKQIDLCLWESSYNYMDLSWIFTKFIPYICLWFPYMCTKFQPDQSIRSWVGAVFVLVRKEEQRKNWIFSLSYPRNGWCNLFQIWNVASHHRKALP